MDILISNLLLESFFDFGKWSNWKLRNYAHLHNFQFDHCSKSKIDSKSRFEMRMFIFLFKKIFGESFDKYEMDDRPSVTETDRGGVYEMDRQTNRQKNGNATEILYKFYINFIRFFTGTRMCYYIGSISVTFPCFLHFSVYPFQRHVLFPFLLHLVCPSVSQALPLHMIVPCACWSSPLDETQGYVFAILRYFKIFTLI